MRDPLIEYVTLVVERIRKRPNDERGKKTRFGNHFDLNRFKQLTDRETMLSYANEFLDRLGRGSSRAAFTLTGRYVLKVALNDKGLAQNEAEIDVFTNPQSKPIVAKIKDADPEHRWLISDLVKPLTTDEELEELLGTSLDELDHALYVGTSSNPLLNAVVKTVRQNDLIVADITKISSWGKTTDGRAVLLDYGYTSGVSQTHYAPTTKRVKASDEAPTRVKTGNSSTQHAPSPRNNTLDRRPGNPNWDVQADTSMQKTHRRS